MGMSIHRAGVEVSVVPFDHFGFIPLSKFCFPSRAILCPPTSISLPKLPIRADDLMASAVVVFAVKLVLKLERYFFQFLFRRRGKEVALAEQTQLGLRPIRVLRCNDEAVDRSWAKNAGCRGVWR